MQFSDIWRYKIKKAILLNLPCILVPVKDTLRTEEDKGKQQLHSFLPEQGFLFSKWIQLDERK